MCEIQIIYGLGQTLQKPQFQKFKAMLVTGAKLNNDAHGYFQLTDDMMFWHKTTRLDNLLPTIEKEPHTKLLVGHNRLATSYSAGYHDNHPFVIKDRLMWVHNGIIWNDDELKKNYKLNYNTPTDSMVIGALINHLMKKKTMTIEQALERTIQEIQGSYSVVVYYQPTKRIFYFKNEATTFTFNMDYAEKVLYGSTNPANLVKEKIVGEMHENWNLELQPAANTIYEFTKQGLKVIRHVEKNEEKSKWAYYSEADYESEYAGLRKFYGTDGVVEKESEGEKEVTSTLTRDEKEFMVCENCGNRTIADYDKKLGMYLCEDCAEELVEEEARLKHIYNR